MKKSGAVSRRAFLGVSGAGLAAGLAPRALAGASPAAATIPEVVTVDVAVIGATLAGLVAARRLEQLGNSVIVLDAGDGLAGDGDVTGVLAAHGRILDLARRHGLRPRRINGAGKRVEVSGGRRLLSAAGSYSADTRLDTEVRRALGRLDWMARETDPTEPWRSPQGAARDGRSLQQWLDSKVPSSAARTRLATLFEAVWGAHPSALSLLHALAVGASSGGITAVVEAATAPTISIPGGVEALRSRLAATLAQPVRTNTPARSVAEDGGSVVVAGDALEVRARRGVLVAAPGAALAGADPGPARVLAQGAGTPAQDAVVCSFPSAQWRRGGLSGHAVVDGSGGAVLQPVGQDADGNPALLVRLAGAGVADVVVSSAFPGVRPSQVRAAHGDGYATLLSPGMLSRAAAAAPSPTGRVAWVGSGTASEWAGHPEGAVQAGLAAADHMAKHGIATATGVA